MRDLTEVDEEALKIVLQRVRESVSYRRYTDPREDVLDAARHLSQQIEE